jgi:hypothetical protein
MKNSKLAAAALVAALPLATIAATAGADSAFAAAPQAKITANVQNPHPTMAHAFRVTGKLTEKGKPANNHLVKIQTQHADGSWHQVRGAQLLTQANGSYNVGLVLNHVRTYHLRAVGVGTGSQPNAHHAFNVRVYR